MPMRQNHNTTRISDPATHELDLGTLSPMTHDINVHPIG